MWCGFTMMKTCVALLVVGGVVEALVSPGSSPASSSSSSLRRRRAILVDNKKHKASTTTRASSIFFPSSRGQGAQLVVRANKSDEDEGEEDSKMSVALPWQERPFGLVDLEASSNEYRVSLSAGDFGFDPMGWTEVGWGFNAGESSTDRLDRVYALREAEIKHSRLAMLAAVGWPVSELYEGNWGGDLLVNPDESGIGLAPSLLNGGLGKVSIVYWAFILAFTAVIEGIGRDRLFEAARISSVRQPGDLGFDPLGLYPSGEEAALSLNDASRAYNLAENLQNRLAVDDPTKAEELFEASSSTSSSSSAPRPPRGPLTPLERSQKRMLEQELTHGRTSMLAVLGYVVQEGLSKVPVVEETPQFFIPDASELEVERELAEVGKASVDILYESFQAILQSAQNGGVHP